MPTYVSQEALDQMKAELEVRTKLTRKEISEQIGIAKDFGDLSENFEYHDAKEQQGLNEARVRELEAKIQDAVLVTSSTGGDEILLGVTFVAEVLDKKKTFSIVGSTEASPMDGMISNESPIGQAFLGRRVGDTVEVTVPSGVMSYVIVSIE
ncbi:MAG: transcription elongation factor GreA [Parcubacteria group bacterium]|nr:transcription elongation factor GreA [Parcubacteria group bacterium]